MVGLLLGDKPSSGFGLRGWRVAESLPSMSPTRLTNPTNGTPNPVFSDFSDATSIFGIFEDSVIFGRNPINIRYTQFGILEDSGIFGRNPWNILESLSTYQIFLSGQPNPWRKICGVDSCYADRVYLKQSRQWPQGDSPPASCTEFSQGEPFRKQDIFILHMCMCVYIYIYIYICCLACTRCRCLGVSCYPNNDDNTDNQ